jgi:ribosomal protein S18 acetylase RimI-like enzyme
VTVVRDARLEDAEAIGTIHVRCWQHAYAGIVAQDLLDSLDEQQRIRQWQERLAAPVVAGTATLVSVDDAGRVTGFARCDRTPGDDPTSGTLAAIYLAPEVIGTGVGRELLAATIERMRAAGFTHAQLDVLPDNTRARRVYEAAGWRAEGDVWTVPWGEWELPHQRYVREL